MDGWMDINHVRVKHLGNVYDHKILEDIETWNQLQNPNASFLVKEPI